MLRYFRYKLILLDCINPENDLAIDLLEVSQQSIKGLI